MGGDLAPSEIVKGTVASAKDYPECHLILTGPAAVLSQELANYAPAENIEIVDAPQVIEMAEEPGRALRAKPDSSIIKGIELVKDGNADAFISAGNTGATMAAALLAYGRLKGVHRPAIAIVVPNKTGRFLLLDAGATADCKPENLLQFAEMGDVYCRRILGVEKPRIALLNIGGEEEKGNTLSKETHKLLKDSHLGFVGNIEGRGMFQGEADVVVCDGFTGNIVLKVVEGFAENTFSYLKENTSKSLRAKIGGWLLKSVLLDLKKKADYEEYGGMPLLGVNGVCIISHGSSKAKAISNAINVAVKTVRTDMLNEIAAGMETHKIRSDAT
jgi:glycerol-3-phosphate acyltransferase PlsX